MFFLTHEMVSTYKNIRTYHFSIGTAYLESGDFSYIKYKMY